MGNYISSDFYIYGRLKETDKYEMISELKEGTPMSRFKHEVFAFSLKKRYSNMKSLYLYCGYSRIAKCIMQRSNEILYLHLIFSDHEIAKEFEQCQEQIQNVYIDISWLEKTFLDSWVIMDTENNLELKYENYKMNIEN